MKIKWSGVRNASGSVPHFRAISALIATGATKATPVRGTANNRKDAFANPAAQRRRFPAVGSIASRLNLAQSSDIARSTIALIGSGGGMLNYISSVAGLTHYSTPIRLMNPIPLRELASVCKVACRNWQKDKAPRMGAALAYYIALAMAPTVLILVATAGLTFGAQAAEGHLVSEIRGLVGYEGAMAIQTMIEDAPASGGIAATMLGLVTVFFAASAVVSELRDAMNTIWKVPEDITSSTARSIFNLVKERIVSFALVLASGLFLVASLIVNAWTFSAGQYLNSGTAPPKALVQTTDWLVSFIVITVLFAFIFKVLPQVTVQWGDVRVSAVATSLLFTAGKVLLGVYLGKAGFTDTYGAAGSLVIILVWVYYSAQVLFLGAEFTRAYACRFGSMRASGNEDPGSH